jgi:hypothetical protein
MRQAHRPHGFNAIARGHARAALCRVGLCLLFCAGCSVDNRTLEGSASSGGLDSIGSGPSETSADAGESGAAGEAASLPRCRYSGSTVDAGCETLVDNPGFAVDDASWTAEDVGVTEAWLKDDADGDRASGSLVVTNSNYSDEESSKDGTAGGGARQCVTVTGGKIYDLTADVFIPKGQGAGFQGQTFTAVGTLSAFFYPGADCQGPSHGNFTSSPVQTADEWVHVAGSVQALKESQSMAVRLATLKPFRQYVFQAEFDNIFVRER